MSRKKLLKLAKSSNIQDVKDFVRFTSSGELQRMLILALKEQTIIAKEGCAQRVAQFAPDRMAEDQCMRYCDPDLGGL